MRSLRHSLLAAAVLSTLLPGAAGSAETVKGRWINDGLGRAARDGFGSTCVSSGGETYAFARQDCDAAADARRAGAAAGSADDVTDIVKSSPARPAEPAPPKAGEPEAARASAEPAPAPQASPPATAPGTAADAAAEAASAGTDAATATAGDAAAAAAGAAGAAGAAAASLTDTDNEPTPVMPEDDSDASDGGAAPTVAGNAAADAKGAEEDPDYAPGSVVLEDHSPGVTPATAPVAEQKPIIDNRAPDFPITKYTADTPKAPANAVDAAAAGAGAAAPSKREAGPMQGDSGPQILKRTLQIERSSLFNSNSAALRTDYVPQLDEVVTTLKNAKSYGTVTVTGHTDRLGALAHNQRLSEERARAVRSYLVMKGLDPAKIVAVGKGPADPVTKAGACNGLKAVALRKCLAPDRRVEITATGTREDVVIKK